MRGKVLVSILRKRSSTHPSMVSSWFGLANKVMVWRKRSRSREKGLGLEKKGLGLEKKGLGLEKKGLGLEKKVLV